MGRATASLLFQSTPQYYPRDLHWSWALGIDDDLLYEFLNVQRARRLANEFAVLRETVSRRVGRLRIVSERQRREEIALRVLEVEILFTRSRPTDLRRGVEIIEHTARRLAASREEKVELSGMRNTLLVQVATMLALDGDYSEAKRVQAMVARSLRALDYIEEWPAWLRKLRYKTVAQKHHGDDSIPYTREQLLFAEAAAESGDLRPLTYLADAELRGVKPTRLLDHLLVEVDDALQTSGYGQDFDYAKPLPLRRRSWALRLIAGEKLDMEVLRGDLGFWKRIQMHNELRELQLLITEIRRKGFKVDIRDALETVLTARGRFV